MMFLLFHLMGKYLKFFFYDISRLKDDIGEGLFLSQPGLIVLKIVNKASIENAVANLWKKGFFKYFKPVASLTQKHFDEEI